MLESCVKHEIRESYEKRGTCMRYVSCERRMRDMCERGVRSMNAL